MNDNLRSRATWLSGQIILVLSFVAISSASIVNAQSGPEADAVQLRMARARALAAAHSLTAAAFELDSIRTTTRDEASREVASIMLMNIYLEEADYTHAQSLLEETFRSRVAGNDSSSQTYFALAGQVINGARTHLERYRAFGINVANQDLPREAVDDLDRLRSLLGHVARQAAEISVKDTTGTDAAALLEEVASLQGSLARNEQEKLKWQEEFANARQRMAASQTRVTTVRTSVSAPNSSAAVASNAGSNAGIAAKSSKSSFVSSTTKRSGVKTKGSITPVKATGPAPAADNASPGQTGSNKRPQNEAAARSDAIREVGSLVERATLKVAPAYPQTAKNAHVSGVVTVHIVVDEKGSVAAVQSTNGPQLLQQAAADAARRWRFHPVIIDGQPARVSGFINFNFTM